MTSEERIAEKRQKIKNLKKIMERSRRELTN